VSPRPDPTPPAGHSLRLIEPLGAPADGTVRPPGSKSVTNRALLVAALASGTSELRGVLEAEDTAAMADCLGALGAGVEWDSASASVRVTGVDGVPARRGAGGGGTVELHARLSGTTARFILASCSLGSGRYCVDGLEPLRVRPMADLAVALRDLGLEVRIAAGDRLPITVWGGPASGGALEVSGAISSQFVSGLAMAGPCLRDGLELSVRGDLVSAPYLSMTSSVMNSFGAEVQRPAEGRLVIPPGGYRATDYAVEADASAASYFLAAAAVTGGRVRVEGVGASSVQGDVAFADVLGQMGCDVRWGPDWVEVAGPPPGTSLRGVSADLRHFSDTAPTLAAVAVFADGPTEITGVGFIRHKETDRIGAVVTELRRLGLEARATEDGLVVEPGVPTPAAVRTYDDHRMAMAFTIIGLVHPGVTIVDPGCVAKTYPGFFDQVDELRRRGAGGR
jgi:3-phosphoshikimate 1-carboxyvinyltransferase